MKKKKQIPVVSPIQSEEILRLPYLKSILNCDAAFHLPSCTKSFLSRCPDRCLTLLDVGKLYLNLGLPHCFYNFVGPIVRNPSRLPPPPRQLMDFVLEIRDPWTKRKWLGSFDATEEAVRDYDVAARRWEQASITRDDSAYMLHLSLVYKDLTNKEKGRDCKRVASMGKEIFCDFSFQIYESLCSCQIFRFSRYVALAMDKTGIPIPKVSESMMLDLKLSFLSTQLLHSFFSGILHCNPELDKGFMISSTSSKTITEFTHHQTRSRCIMY